MQDNRIHIHDANQCRKNVSISQIAHSAIAQFQHEIDKRNIVVEIDMQETTAHIDPAGIHSAVSQLLENAVDSMPNGGELCVTLIDGLNQWELEIADSADRQTHANESQPRLKLYDPDGEQMRETPNPESNDGIQTAHSVAMNHGGHIQTWDCPQGGTAQVLVIPRISIRKAA